MTTRTRISFRVYGTEFCRILEAVSYFQASPRTFAVYAAVRGIARHDGLSLAALNGASAAIGHVDTEGQDGVGLFSIPHSQVKPILGLFKRKLPKDHFWDEYVLEVTVTDEQIRIHDTSMLFEGSALTIDVRSQDSLERHEQSESELAMSAAASVLGGIEEDRPLDTTSGVYFPHDQLAIVARAAKVLGVEVHQHPIGRRMVYPLGEDFVAYTAAQIRDRETSQPPFIDERALRSWRDRLEDVVTQGAF